MADVKRVKKEDARKAKIIRSGRVPSDGLYRVDRATRIIPVKRGRKSGR